MFLYHSMDMDDWTYHAGRVVLFNGPDPALSILAGCLPIMSPCLRLASSRIKSRFTLSKRSNRTEPSALQRPPTIGQGERLPLKTLRLESEGSQKYQRLEEDGYPVATEALGVMTPIKEGKRKQGPEQGDEEGNIGHRLAKT